VGRWCNLFEVDGKNTKEQDLDGSTRCIPVMLVTRRGGRIQQE
jgi:hypothetical protein